METIFIACSLVLVLVLGTAGIAKFRSGQGPDQVLRALGFTGIWPRAGAAAIAPLELGLALLLLIPGAASWGAWIATALFAVFAALTAVLVRRGQAPSCNCFGQQRSQPVDRTTVARALLLASMAGALAWTENDATGDGLVLAASETVASYDGLAVSWLILVPLIGALVWLNVELMQQQGRLLLKTDELEHRLDAGGIPAVELMPDSLRMGQEAPRFTAPALDGTQVSLAFLQMKGTPLLLVFANPDCAPCLTLLPDLVAWQSSYPSDHMLVISSGSEVMNREKFSEIPASDVILQENGAINALFGVRATPSAIRIDEHGRIVSHLAVGKDAILALAVSPHRPLVETRLKRPVSAVAASRV